MSSRLEEGAVNSGGVGVDCREWVRMKLRGGVNARAISSVKERLRVILAFVLVGGKNDNCDMGIR